MFQKLRKRLLQPREQVVVQLHRVQHNRDQTITILSSWAPIKENGWRQAYATAQQLRQDNCWAGPNYGPWVSVTGEDGVRHDDAIMSPWSAGEDGIYDSKVRADR